MLYFGTTGWSSGGNLANHQAGSNPKYITAGFSSVAGGCTNYYTFDAGTEATGNGSGVSYASPPSTSTASPTNPNSYTSSGCALPVVMPLDLLGFSASPVNANEVKLSFTTAREKNVARFTISKSPDAINFYPLMALTATNTEMKTVYTAWDEAGENDTRIYYRLEEEDKNGIKKVLGLSYAERMPDQEPGIYQSESGIKIISPVVLQSVSLFSSEGMRIAASPESINETNYTLAWGDLPKGIYILRICDVNEKVTIKKIIR